MFDPAIFFFYKSPCESYPAHLISSKILNIVVAHLNILSATGKGYIMHIIIGDLYDPFCFHVNEMLKTHKQSVSVISNPLLDPCRFEWRLSNEESRSWLLLNGEIFFDNEIESVFVRTFGWIDPEGWQKDDLAYMQSETHAALLAWLWSLNSIVVNRFSPNIWYRPRPPLLFWQPLLKSVGLNIVETLITNAPEEANKFKRQLDSIGIGGAVYNSLTAELSYLIKEPEEWNGIIKMQKHTPVCFSYPHGQPEFVCIVGEKVIWNDGSSTRMKTLDPLLLAFANSAGLNFVALALDPANCNVIVVDPYPKWDHFGDEARQQIIEEIVSFLQQKKPVKKTAQALNTFL